jgi:hypothetical protein
MTVSGASHMCSTSIVSHLAREYNDKLKLHLAVNNYKCVILQVF